MFEKMITLLVTEQSTAEKLSTLGGVLIFVCFLYWILPRAMRNRIKGYDDQCAIDDDEEKSEDKNSEV